jgi:mannose-6-phosphate isomerase
MTNSFYKCSPFNFVPLTRTPWAGKQISQLKSKSFPESHSSIPEKIGESWEISTDSQFPSQIKINEKESIYLMNLLASNPDYILGKDVYKKYGSHFPLLLKWLQADDLLSVQLHPNNKSSLLKENECGKPEAWLVLNVEEGGFVYLGFKENLTKEEIIFYLKTDQLDQCLHKYYPKKFDYISVPCGAVHAVGTGVLLAEPQYVLPNKIAKTWRISDWGRLYDENGKQSPNGKPRELHVDESFSAIDWSLKRGKELEKLLIQNVSSGDTFLGNEQNPFALKVYGINENENNKLIYQHLLPNSFSLFTVWSGSINLTTGNECLQIKAGESGFICAASKEVSVEILNGGSIAFFALNDSYL